MLNEYAYAKLSEVFNIINQSVEDTQEKELSAKEAFSYLSDPNIPRKLVKFMSTSELTHRPISDFTSPQQDWPYLVGLDSSNTRTIRLNTGEVATASLATFGISGTTDEEVENLKNHQTVNAVVYSGDETFSLPEVDNDEEFVTIDLFQLPANIETDKIEQWVQGISLLHSEFKHPESLLSEINGPLFIDGPIYSGNMFWYLRHKYNQDHTGENKQTPLDKVEEPLIDILQSRINTIDTLYNKNIPVIGIVKTTTSDSVVSEIKRAKDRNTDGFLPADEKVRWHRDTPFFHELFKETQKEVDIDEPIISYTPWMVREFHNVGNDKIHPFRDYPKIEFNMNKIGMDAGDETPTYEDYQIAFFYITVPFQEYCLRVEVPRGFVNKQGEAIQELVAAQIAAEKDIPAPIKFADNEARIPEDVRAQLKARLKGANDNFNEHRGYT